MRLVEHDGSFMDLLRRYFQPVWSMAVAIGLGGVFYMVSLKSIGIKGAYATAGGDILAFVEIPRRFVEVTWNSFYALWVTQPEFGRHLKLVLLAALFLAAAFLAAAIAARHLGRKGLIAVKWAALAVLLAGLVMATKTLFYTVSMPDLFFYRYNPAMPFFTAFCFYAIFATASGRRFGTLRSLAAVAACCVVFVFIRADLTRQGILLAGHRHDLHVVNRIVERVESLPDLDFSKTYYLVRLGAYSPERSRMMNHLRPYEIPGCGHMDSAEVGGAWATEYPPRMLGSRVRFKGMLPNHVEIRKRAADLVREREAGHWPHPSSVFIVDDMIIVNM